MGELDRTRTTCESDVTGPECFAEVWLNDWNGLCDKTTGCKYPGKTGEYPDAIEVSVVGEADGERELSRGESE